MVTVIVEDFYATGNSKISLFSIRFINNNYTEYHTSYWTDGKITG